MTSTRRRAPSPPESAIQRAIIEWLTWQGWLVLRQNTGAFLNPQGHLMRFGEVGLPDLQAIKEGRTVFIEVKRPVVGRVTEKQRVMHERLRKHGVMCIVAYSLEDVQAALAEGVA